jgi:hypothetical protein
MLSTQRDKVSDIGGIYSGRLSITTARSPNGLIISKDSNFAETNVANKDQHGDSNNETDLAGEKSCQVNFADKDHYESGGVESKYLADSNSISLEDLIA